MRSPRPSLPVLIGIAVLVAVDRLGAIVAAHVLAGQVKTDEHLPHRPSTSIGGFPFLTQAIGGKYKDVTVEATDLPVDGVSVTSLTVHLHGVHIPLGKVIHDSVVQVPVDRVDGTALVAFADLNTYLSSHHPLGQVLALRPGTGNTATVFDRLHVGNKVFSLHGVGTISLRGNVVDVGVAHLAGPRGASGASGAVSATLIRQALKRLKIAVPFDNLPFRITLTSVRFTSTGVTVAGGAKNTVLGASGD